MELTNEQILLIGKQYFKEGASTTDTTLQAYCDSVRAVITTYGLRAPDLEATPTKPGRFGGEEWAWRMDAYYYGFGATGIAIIDRILSAVACAGKAYHHTDQWTSDCTPYEHLRGETVTDWIQNAADDAAAVLRASSATASDKEGA